LPAVAGDNKELIMRKLLSGVVVAGMLTSFALVAGQSAGATATAPSGQRTIGGATLVMTANGPAFTGGGASIEPAYDDSTGTLVYLSTPTNGQVNLRAAAKNVAPIYLPIYPSDDPGIDPTTLNCQHVDLGGNVSDNCPDHGPAVAGAVVGLCHTPQLIQLLNCASTYTDPNKILGHDHLVGIASTGGDFNILWVPTLVLFTSADAAAAVGHITTLSQIRAAEAAGQATEFALPPLTFHCGSVSAAVYNAAAPVAPFTGA
jgi:hypothetical protein